MTPQEFQIKLGPQLKEFITSKLGQSTIAMVHAMKPNYEPSTHEHIFLENRGAVRGYELCLRNFAALTFAPVIKTDAQQDYGVKETQGSSTPHPSVFQTQPVVSETQV